MFGKLAATSAVLLGLVAIGSTAEAQYAAYGYYSSDGYNNSGYYGSSYYDSSSYYGGANPVEYQTPAQVNSYSYDWRTGYVAPNTSGYSQYRSARDPYRGYVAPGSARYVDRWEQDASGRWARVTGTEWNSVTGNTHGNLVRQSTNPSGGVHTEYITKSARKGSSSSSGSNAGGTTKNSQSSRKTPSRSNTSTDQAASTSGDENTSFKKSTR